MSQMPNKAPGPTPTSVRIERHFDVLPGKVWRGWTDPEVVRQWFGSDPAGKVLAVQLDVRPGGSFEVSFMDSNGTEHTCSGVFADVQPETKLSFSWRWKSEPGVETFVSVLLERRGTGTQLSTHRWAVHRCMTTLPAGRAPLESWSVRSQRSHEMPLDVPKTQASKEIVRALREPWSKWTDEFRPDRRSLSMDAHGARSVKRKNSERKFQCQLSS